MIVAHDSGCPTLCQERPCYDDDTTGTHGFHVCACRAAEDLRELVRAVKYTLDSSGMGLTTLGKALQPFREGK